MSPSPRKPLDRLLRLMVVLAALLSALVVALWLARWFHWLPQSTTEDSLAAVQQLIRLPQLPTLQRDQIVLLMGVDHNRPGQPRDGQLFKYARTDTIVLARFSPATNSISALSLPRDSKVYTGPNNQVGKLNQAFTTGGIDQAKQVVEDSFGVPVDHAVVVHLQAIQTLVNELGGITVTLPQPMRYRDRTDGLTINLPAGQQTLTGEQAVGYLRFRHDRLGDIGRIRRQQYFMAAVKQRLNSADTLLKLPGLLTKLGPYMQTDMDTAELMALANFARGVKPSGLRIATLPGRGSTTEAVSYWIIAPYEARQLLNRLMFNTTPSEAALRGDSPLRVGVIYPKGAQAWVDQLEAVLDEQAALKLTCRKASDRVAQSALIEQSLRVRDEDSKRLQAIWPRLVDLPTIVAPHNTTYETLGCSPRDDFTLVIAPSLKHDMGPLVRPQGQ